MPGTDGLSLARSLRGSSTPALALVTAHQQYAVQAFDVQALDYLLKPVDDDPVAEAVRRVGVYLGFVRQGGLPAVDRFGEIIVEFATHRVSRCGRTLDVRPSYAESVTSRTVDTHVAALRRPSSRIRPDLGSC